VTVLVLILLVLALVLILCRAFGVAPPRVHLGWLGLACYVLVALVGAAGLH
jgi:ABC-type multidrug transport system permease subunit